VRLRAELEEKTELLDRLAREDELTKLQNRRGFVTSSEQAFAIADRDGKAVQIVFFDVDGLKRINDESGHEVGDEALRRLASAITAETRATDVIARLGGDEFVALLYGATSSEAKTTVERIVDACSDRVGRLPPVRFSYGIVERRSGSTTSLDHLLHEADQRMYDRKARSKG
jgi:diguanylate cyclase (GGDEF)-like protein